MDGRSVRPVAGSRAVRRRPGRVGLDRGRRRGVASRSPHDSLTFRGVVMFHERFGAWDDSVEIPFLSRLPHPRASRTRGEDFMDDHPLGLIIFAVVPRRQALSSGQPELRDRAVHRWRSPRGQARTPRPPRCSGASTRVAGFGGGASPSHLKITVRRSREHDPGNEEHHVSVTIGGSNDRTLSAARRTS